MATVTLPETPNVALLVQGVDTSAVSGDASPVDALALEPVLLRSTGWSVRTASATRAEHLPNRIGFKQAVRRALAEVTGRLVLALSVEVVDAGGVPSVVTDTDWAAFPEDSSLELSWLRSELRDVEARMLVVAVEVIGGDLAPDAVFEALDVGRPDRLLVVAQRSEFVQADDQDNADVPGFWSTLAGALAAEATSSLEDLSVALSEADPTACVGIHGDPTARVRASASPTLPCEDFDSAVVLDLEAAQQPSPTLVGTMLPGRFRLTRELARGAHGVVYMARQLSVNRLVAVKVLDDRTTSGKRYSANHFVAEIQTIGRLDHPNVIHIYQADRTPDGRPFYAMELVRGPTLEALLDEEGSLAPERAVSLARQVLSGLHAAHTAGVVHSDVKPSNVALQPPASGGEQDERAIVFDFGVARLRDENPHRGSQAIGASLAYMAPEQAFDGKVDVRSDLFAVGLLLYTMLTGWQRDTLDEMIPPLTPAAITDPHLLAVLRRALSFDSNERFQSAREFLAALSGVADADTEADEFAPPFRYLSGFTEADRWRFHGRALATAQLTDLVLYNQVVVLTGPDGAGKSSLTRAGLLPRLGDLRCHTAYVRCGGDPVADAATGLVQGERDLVHAVRHWVGGGSSRVVLIFDEVDALASDAGTETAEALFDAIGACCSEFGDGVSFVLVVRQDELPMLKTLRDRVSDGPPVMRLGPLTDRGAREALLRPLEARDITVAPEALDSLVEALHELGRVLYWANEDVVPAPHVQLLGGMLYDALPQGFTGAISLEQCQDVQPIESLVERWVARCLSRASAAGVPGEVLRSVLLVMADEDGRPQPRNEAELGDIDDRLGRDVLDELVAQQLLVRGSRPGLMPTWEIVHPLAISAVNAWLNESTATD